MKTWWSRVRTGMIGVTAGIGVMLAGHLPAAAAAFDTYAVMNGVTGESQYMAGAFEVKTLSYGVDNSMILAGTSSSGAKQANRAAFAPIVMTREVDAASGTLYADAESGQPVTGTIYVVQAIGSEGKPVTFFELHFAGIVSGFSDTIDAGSQPEEQITIVPITETLTFNKASGPGVTLQKPGYNLQNQKNS